MTCGKDLAISTLSRQFYPASDEISEVLNNGEEGKDDPVGEPLRIVVLHRALQGLDGAVGRVEEAHSVGQQLVDKIIVKIYLEGKPDEKAT